MLVTFSCPAYADITMFGDIAVRLLKLMGQGGAVPGALAAEDVHTARVRLETGVAEFEEPPAQAVEDENGEPVVSLQHRAFPLLELLRAAEKAKAYVMWDKKT
jgi:hypothetical protein